MNSLKSFDIGISVLLIIMSLELAINARAKLVLPAPEGAEIMINLPVTI